MRALLFWKSVLKIKILLQNIINKNMNIIYKEKKNCKQNRKVKKKGGSIE